MVQVKYTVCGLRAHQWIVEHVEAESEKRAAAIMLKRNKQDQDIEACGMDEVLDVFQGHHHGLLPCPLTDDR